MKRTSLPWKFAAISALVASSSLFAADKNPAPVVKRELDTNGQFYSYIDFEGGWGKVASDVNQSLKETSWKNRDFVALADALGLSQIRALGMSSTSLKDGYDNRIFLHTPGGRKGLLAIFPGEAASFEGARYAPADTDLFAEVRLDVAAVVGAITQIATSVSDKGEAAAVAIDLLRKDPTGFGALLNFKGRVVAIVRLHSQADIEKAKTEGSARAPVDVFLRADGGAAAVTKAIAKMDSWKREEHGGRVYFNYTADENEGVVIVEGETVTAGFPRAFVEESLARKSGLTQSAPFKQALADTAQKGHGIVYITPRAFTECIAGLSKGSSLLSGLPFGHFGTADRLFVNQVLSALQTPTKPIASVIVARADGILVRERSMQSLKASLPITGLLTPDFLGQIFCVGAQAFAINDAKEHARQVIHEKIAADLDHASLVARKYFAKQTEVETVKLSQLREGWPEEKLPDFQDVTESDIEFSRNSDQVEFELKSGYSITHVFKLTPEQQTTIKANLQKLAEASIDYLIAGHSDTSLDSLVDQGFMAKPEPVVGEDYDQVTLSLDMPTLTVKTPGEQEISFTRDPLAVPQARRRQAERQIAIERNLAKIDAIAQQFLIANPDESSVSYEQLVQKELVSDIKPVAGEDYVQELSSITKNQDKLSISTQRTGTVTWLRPLPEATRADFTKRLSEIERSAVKYFANNPSAEVVISGELLPPPAVKEAKPDAPSTDETEDSSENAEKKLPDLTALVIRRDYQSIKITFENGQEIEVPRSPTKK